MNNEFYSEGLTARAAAEAATAAGTAKSTGATEPTLTTRTIEAAGAAEPALTTRTAGAESTGRAVHRRAAELTGATAEALHHLLAHPLTELRMVLEELTECGPAHHRAGTALAAGTAFISPSAASALSGSFATHRAAHRAAALRSTKSAGTELAAPAMLGTLAPRPRLATLRRRAEIASPTPRTGHRAAPLGTALRSSLELAAAGETTRALTLRPTIAAGTVIVFIVVLGLTARAAIEAADDDVFLFHARAAPGAALTVRAARPGAEPHHAWRPVLVAITPGIGRTIGLSVGLAIGPGIGPVAALGFGTFALAPLLRRRTIIAIIIAHVGPAVAFAPGFGRGRIIVFNNDHAPFDHFTSGRAIGAAVLRQGRHGHVPEREK